MQTSDFFTLSALMNPLAVVVGFLIALLFLREPSAEKVVVAVALTLLVAGLWWVQGAREAVAARDAKAALASFMKEQRDNHSKVVALLAHNPEPVRIVQARAEGTGRSGGDATPVVIDPGSLADRVDTVSAELAEWIRTRPALDLPSTGIRDAVATLTQEMSNDVDAYATAFQARVRGIMRDAERAGYEDAVVAALNESPSDRWAMGVIADRLTALAGKLREEVP